jgi:hypothetical protein
MIHQCLSKQALPHTLRRRILMSLSRARVQSPHSLRSNNETWLVFMLNQVKDSSSARALPSGDRPEPGLTTRSQAPVWQRARPIGIESVRHVSRVRSWHVNTQPDSRNFCTLQRLASAAGRAVRQSQPPPFAADRVGGDWLARGRSKLSTSVV